MSFLPLRNDSPEGGSVPSAAQGVHLRRVFASEVPNKHVRQWRQALYLIQPPQVLQGGRRRESRRDLKFSRAGRGDLAVTRAAAVGCQRKLKQNVSRNKTRADVNAGTRKHLNSGNRRFRSKHAGKPPERGALARVVWNKLASLSATRLTCAADSLLSSNSGSAHCVATTAPSSPPIWMATNIYTRIADSSSAMSPE